MPDRKRVEAALLANHLSGGAWETLRELAGAICDEPAGAATPLAPAELDLSRAVAALRDPAPGA